MSVGQSAPQRPCSTLVDELPGRGFDVLRGRATLAPSLVTTGPVPAFGVSTTSADIATRWARRTALIAKIGEVANVYGEVKPGDLSAGAPEVRAWRSSRCGPRVLTEAGSQSGRRPRAPTYPRAEGDSQICTWSSLRSTAPVPAYASVEPSRERRGRPRVQRRVAGPLARHPPERARGRRPTAHPPSRPLEGAGSSAGSPRAPPAARSAGEVTLRALDVNHLVLVLLAAEALATSL